MLSWTLRRKSAPPAVDVDTGVDLPTSAASSPSRSSRGRSKSLSSKGSLSSLFSKSKKDDAARSMDPAELVDVVEGDLYPVYDATNTDYTSSLSQRGRASPSPVRSRSRSRKPTLRKAGSKSSLQPSRNILESIASKLKSATEYFHKDSSSSDSSEDSRHSKASSTRSLSPKKSVRFRSGTFSNLSDANSAPIAVPEKTTPRLLHLKLPSGDLLRDVTNEALQDPIPTGRPQATPMLKGESDSDYFFPFPTEIDQQLDDLKGQRGKAKPLPLIDLKKRASDQENPFDDAAAPSVSAEKPPVAAEATKESEAAVAVPPDFPRAESLGEKWSRFSPSKPPEEDSHNRRAESESNVTNPFCESVASFEETTVPQSTPESNVVDVAMPAPPSVWDLESRTLGNAKNGDGQDSDDSDSSASIMARLRRSSKQTHEDIRLQFRRRAPKDNPGSSPLTVLPGRTVTSSPHDVRGLITDANKLPSSPICSVVGVEDAVSPLNLTPERPSSTPLRTRSFRFANQTPPGAGAEIRPRGYRWAGSAFAEDIPTTVAIDPKRFEDKTPSPVVLPLPLSVAPKPQVTSKWRDQHGWTPFDEPLFPEAFAKNQDVHHMLRSPGGMSQLWNVLDLPRVTAPEDDTRALTAAGIKNMLQFCIYLHSADNVGGPDIGHQFTHRNSMSELFSPHSDYLNPYAPLEVQSFDPDDASTADDGVVDVGSPSLRRSSRKYSGEVSTNSDASCSKCKSQTSSCRCTDSTQTTQSSDQEELPSEAIKWQAGAVGVRTPTKEYVGLASHSQLASLENTPKQSDSVQRSSLAPIRELSSTTTDTNTTESDEEQYVRGII